MTNDELYQMTKNFLLGESKETPTIVAYTESVKNFLDNLNPRSMKEGRQLTVIKENVKKIRSLARSMQERVSILEEQVKVLEEGQH